jgi:hypothetical protein
MRHFRSVLGPATAIGAALVFAALSVAPAVASGHTILRSGFIGVVPATDPVNPSPTIAGVPPAGAPWVLDANSRTRVREDGRITVVLKHLVIPGRVPGNPVATMAASLVCGDMVVDSTKSFAVDPDGNGRVSDRIMGTKHCSHPMVLIRNATGPALGAWFAVSDG